MEDPESEWGVQEYSPSKEGETSMVKFSAINGTAYDGVSEKSNQIIANSCCFDRMEDPKSEWEFHEYSPSKEGETSMVKWILKNGYGIGKKMVITGIVISSAPLVLPPLVVLSAMGVAVSVPFGLVFASYACINKLMSMLLPPPPPLMLEYYALEGEEKEGRLLTNLDGIDVIRDGVMQEEEEERIGDVEFELDENRDVYSHEMEVLVKNVNEKGYYCDEDDEVRLENVVQEEEAEGIDDVKQGVDDGGVDYRQCVGALISNVDENVDGKDWYSDENKEVLVERENIFQEEVKKQIDDLKEGIEVRFELDDVDDNVHEKGQYTDEIREEKERVERENMFNEVEDEQIEDLRQGEKVCFGIDDVDENVKQGVEITVGFNVAGDKHNPTEDESIAKSGGTVDEKGYEEDTGEYLEGDDDSLEEERKNEKLLVEMEPEVVDGLDVVKKEIKVYHDEEELTKDEDEAIVKESTGLLEKIRNKESLNNITSNEVFNEVKDVEIPEPVTVKEIDSRKLVVVGIKNPEPVGKIRHVVLAGGSEENNFNSRQVAELDLVARGVLGDMDGSKDTISRAKREHLVHSNSDVREIGDESGLDLFDDRNESTNQNTSIIFKSLKAGEVTEHSADENVDVMALPDFKRASLDSDNAKITSKTDTDVPFRKDILDDKIWEKIEAMRAIVGFKAPRQSTCIGELKALYVFTGVEPPASFKDKSDLDEVNAKLKFLMSIVGVR